MMTILRKISMCIVMLCATLVATAQSNGDKLFKEGKKLQQVMTVKSQNDAIKKFQGAKTLYTSADKKALCDDEISTCKKNISKIDKSGGGKGGSSKTFLTLSQDQVIFDGDVKGKVNIDVNASSQDWNFSVSQGVEGERNFVSAIRSADARQLFINAAANPSTLERYQTIRVSCGDSSKVMKLIQKGKTVTLSASTAMLNYKIKGGDKSIELYTNSDSVVKDNNGATWYVESKPEWAEVTLDVKKKGFLSIVKDAVTGTVEAATADDVKKSNVKIYVQSILKSDPEYSTGRRGEVVFASQDKRYKVIIIQQK